MLHIFLSFRMRSLLLLAAISALVGCDGESGFPLSPASLFGKQDPSSRTVLPCSDPATAQQLVGELLEALNSERAKHDLRPLKPDPTLTRVAEFYACRMIEGSFFGHQDPFDGSTVDARAANFGYAYYKVGENLAAGHNTVAEVMAHWLRSPGHRANILDPAFKDIGIAVKQGGQFGIYWVQEFGRPITAPPIPLRSPNPPAAEDPATTTRADLSPPAPTVIIEESEPIGS